VKTDTRKNEVSSSGYVKSPQTHSGLKVS